LRDNNRIDRRRVCLHVSGKLRTVTVAVLLLLPAIAPAQPDRGRSEVFRPGDPGADVEFADGRRAAKGEVLFRFRDSFLASAGQQQINSAIADIRRTEDADLFELIGESGVLRLRSRSRNTEQLVRQLSRRPDVLYAEPNHIVQASAAATNDPRFSELWGLQNTGQGTMPGTAGADIKAVKAWAMTTGSAANVVAVIDTGVDYNHPDLAPNMWRAPAAFSVVIGGVTINCAAGARGYNAITNTCDPMDDQDHGTHVAGTIGAVGNNAVGVVGVNHTTRIMGLKFLNAQGYGTIADAIKAIEFAIQVKTKFAATKGANIRILNNSWGGDGYSQAMVDAIRRAGQSDMLFVAAAGNDSMNIDMKPTYPASYKEPNVITVAATDNRDALAWFSNYGATSTHLGAPGDKILSTTRLSGYKSLSGTSMATPHVAGAAALVLSNCPVDTAGLRDILLRSVDKIGSMSGITTTGGRLNAATAVSSCTAPYYTISVSPAEQVIPVGSTKQYTVTITPFRSYQGSVTLSTVDLPPGVTGTFQPATVNVSAATVLSVLSVTAPLNTIPGIHRFAVQGTSGNQQRTGLASMRVPGYSVTDLGSLPVAAGSRNVQAHDINSIGQIAGISNMTPTGWSSTFRRAYLHSNGTMRDLGTLGGFTSEAYGIGKMGHVVGSSLTNSGYAHAFVWANGSMRDLGALPGHYESYAYGVNDSGHVVGYSTSGSLDEKAFLVTTGAMQNLGTLGGTRTRAAAINNTGQIVGYSQLRDYSYHAFLFSNGTIKDLGTIGNNAAGTSHAVDINDKGQVAGSSTVGTDTSVLHAFLWSNGTFTDLGTLPGYAFSYARGLNANGHVVGFVSQVEDRFAGDAKRAFLYREGRLLDLNDAIAPGSSWTLLQANAINDNGAIVGTGKVNGENRAFLLTPLK
jgi:probable HAF family extracellular repeat protein